MKLCSNCGSQMPDEAVICTNCGAPLQANQVPQQAYQQPTYVQQPYDQQAYGQQPYGQMPNSPEKGKAIASLVCGIIGLVLGFLGFVTGVSSLIGLILCIVGIVLAVKARNAMPVGVPGRGMATGGLVCGIIGAVLSGIIALCVICAAGCVICAGAGAGAGATTDWNSYDWSTILFM
jgi:Predicted membrane protein